MTHHAIEPLRLRLADGEEREFLLTNAGYRQIKTALGAKSMKDLVKVLQDDDRNEDAVSLILYQGLRDKANCTQEQFEDLLPFDLQWQVSAVTRLLAGYVPESNGRPPVASLETANQTGSGSGHTVSASSESVTTPSGS